MKIDKSIRCPSYETDCVYCVRGWCQLEEETGDHPREQCDEYAWYNPDEDEDEDEED